mmetsp:Transcript_4632/g.11176  ORF Transcript_4632/g.11176 Transcript_4632/m.11176 type:complete len:212 (+) Transcript_4632:270-905(+)
MVQHAWQRIRIRWSSPRSSRSTALRWDSCRPASLPRTGSGACACRRCAGPRCRCGAIGAGDCVCVHGHGPDRRFGGAWLDRNKRECFDGEAVVPGCVSCRFPGARDRFGRRKLAFDCFSSRATTRCLGGSRRSRQRRLRKHGATGGLAPNSSAGCVCHERGAKLTDGEYDSGDPRRCLPRFRGPSGQRRKGGGTRVGSSGQEASSRRGGAT